MRDARAVILALSCLVLAAYSDDAFAQTTGDIRGTVTDSAGAPLPGATVQMRSPALQGTRTAVSDATGVFRLPLVPPGSYHLKATLAGFNPEERKDLRVGLGETTTVPITLILAATEAVEVAGEVPLVDTTSTKIGTSLPAAAITKLPLGRNFSSAMLTVGGTGTDSQGNTAYGATGLENNYIVDGSNTGSIGMFELTVPPGSNVPPPHSHSNNEECVYVLTGTLRYTVGAETRDLSQGQSMSTPKGVVHGFSNPFTEAATALIVLSPDIGAEYFKDVAVVVNAGGPPDKAALLSVMSKYGLVPAAPK